MIQTIKASLGFVTHRLQRLDPWNAAFLLLVARLYLVWVFFRSGLVKLQSWDTTLMLFEYEYNVPGLPPLHAAWLGTGAELVLPVLLSVGLATRFSAVGLFILNAVALISYPEISPAGVKDHYLWGWLLATLLFLGGGRWAMDRWIVSWARAPG